MSPKSDDEYSDKLSLANLKPRLIYQDETGFEFASISNDKRYLAFGKPGGDDRGRGRLSLRHADEGDEEHHRGLEILDCDTS
ncbi:MAG: hypothetical protein M3Y86_12570 [Verrucomicrobiota bacterium]|nr:hypothetical protein [Verrucomicrobiota bacterium]